MLLKKIVRRFLKITGGIILFFLLYFLLVLGLAYVPTNSDFKPCTNDAVEIYILTNGVHTDLVLPLNNNIKDWSAFVNPVNTKLPSTNFHYVAFGWGDKGFYLETPTWADLKFKTAFKAMFFLSTSDMHVSFYESLKENESCKKICISLDSYTKLITYIDNSFQTLNKMPMLIKGASYGNNDLFYDANGTYSMFYTCNSWANSGLKAAHLKACLWTLFDKSIFDKY